VAERVRELKIPGIDFVRESKRYYPLRGLAAHVVGFSGVDNTGLAGVEERWNGVLSGEAVERTVLVDALKGTVLAPGLAFRDARPGGDLHLTIDGHLQHVAETELARAVELRGAKSGTALLMDPNSGAILAMASVPAFDPNRFGQVPSSVWRNPVVMDAFEPGSTFKLVTAAAALEANLLDPNDVIDCRMGEIEVTGRRIRDHKPFGRLTFREVIAKSSNVGAVEAGLLVGEERLYEQILRFGFGEPTGIDLPGGETSRGIVHPVERWHSRAAAYISFGQGVSVSALQLANAYAAIANGGTLHRPFVVYAVAEEGERRLLHQQPTVLGHPVSASVALTLERMLEMVVEEGTGVRAAIPGYRVAGKTGTAQKAVDGRYSSDKHLASFVGFAPARRPAVLGLVVIDEPAGVLYHGGDVAAPVFASIVGEALTYLGIPAERKPEAEVTVAAGIESPPGQEVPLTAAIRLPLPTEAGPAATEPGEGQVPDFRGLTARQALVRSSRDDLEVRLYGLGFVSRQSPEAGTPIESAERGIDLWLASGAGS